MNDKTMEQISEEEKKVNTMLEKAWKSYNEKKDMLRVCLKIMHGTESDRIAATYVAGYCDGYKAKELSDLLKKPESSGNLKPRSF